MLISVTRISHAFRISQCAVRIRNIANVNRIDRDSFQYAVKTRMKPFQRFDIENRQARKVKEKKIVCVAGEKMGSECRFNWK